MIQGYTNIKLDLVLIFVIMASILSIQSHVVCGYVGNKAATYPLQAMGFDVWPINTVQFSNHTGYGKWQGQVFTAAHIIQLVEGIFDINQQHRCQAILSGYMGSAEICQAVSQVVSKFKNHNPNVIYLCDPVIGNNRCYVKPEVLGFFKDHLSADIITPNQYEAEVLSGIPIKSKKDLQNVAAYFHRINIKVVVITGVKFLPSDKLKVFVSDQQRSFFIEMPVYNFNTSINGTGDLFSSMFLGAYLHYKSLVKALQYASYFLDQVVKATLLAQEQELQVLSVNFKDVEISKLPKINLL